MVSSMTVCIIVGSSCTLMGFVSLLASALYKLT